MDSYFLSYKGKRAAVIGVGVSNLPLARKLLEYGAIVTLHDRKERLGKEAESLVESGASACLGERYLDVVEADVIFRSPGVRPDEPGIARAVRAGAVLTSEMEAFFEVCPCPIYAVTGSDGKTTTTMIMSLMLRAAGRRVHVGGNIGTPLLCKAGEMSPEDVAVVELSSFQLLTMRRSPDVAVITNLAPNHLDKHLSMQEYVDAKRNIYLYQKKSGLLVTNADNDITSQMARQAPGRVRLFSRRGPVRSGCSTDGETVFFESEGKKTALYATREILLPGVHNLENYMAASAALAGEVPREAMSQTARSFTGVEHRLELVRTHNGVRYYNDSIASSPTRTAAGLRSFDQKVILIAGGYDKHIPFDELGRIICEKVRTLVLCGPTAPAIQKAVEEAGADLGEQPRIMTCTGFDEAVMTAARSAQSGDCVLMSPACASFDAFENFMERGERFRQLITAL